VGCADVIADQVLAVAPGSEHVHLDLPPEPRAAGMARRWVRDHLRWLDDEQRASAELLASELVTNAVVHARTPVTVGLTALTDGVLLTVADLEPAPPVTRAPSDSGTSGRGMRIMRELASRCGVAMGPNGKTVWFVVPAAAAVTA